MKTINKIMLALFVALAFSCSQEDDEIDQSVLPVTMEFVSDLSFPERSAAQEIEISFDRSAPEAGTLTIEVSPADASGFITSPAVVDGEIQLEIAKGATGASFIFEPENDEELQGNRTINFILVDGDDNFLIGDKDTAEITIFEDEVAASASFAWSSVVLLENETAEVKLPVVFSVPVPGAATVKIKVEGEAVGDYLSTVPAMDANNVIELKVVPGVWDVSIQLQPKNNANLFKHQNLKLRIIEVSGPLTMGDRPELDLLLKDDELVGRLQSVETINGSRKVLKTLEYNPDGQIGKVITEENTSGYRLVQNYNYDSNGNLISITGVTGDYESFTWENGKIVKSELVSGFFGITQNLFEYEDGKLTRKRVFDLDGNRNATETNRFTYTYYSTGDLKTQVHTSFVDGNWKEISSRNYGYYNEVVNPSPVEAAPGLHLQLHLNGTLSIKQNGQTTNLTYTHTYLDGKVTERHDGSESIKYKYY